MQNSLVVSYDELYNFRHKSAHKNKIRKFWKNILRTMPQALKEEALNTLVSVTKGNPSIFKNAYLIPYKFEAYSSNEQLQYYLNQFVLLVNVRSNKELDWKEKFKY